MYSAKSFRILQTSSGSRGFDSRPSQTKFLKIAVSLLSTQHLGIILVVKTIHLEVRITWPGTGRVG